MDVRAFDSSLLLRCYPNSASCSSVLYANGGLADFPEMSFMKHYLREGDSFLDIGANVGIYTILAASLVGNSGKVFSVEAAPASAQRLREQVRLNNLEEVVSVFEGALSNQSGTVEFTTERDSMNKIHTGEGSNSPTVSVPCARLDEVLDNDDWSFAMGKLDVEGAEPLVMEGGAKMLEAHNPPVWVVEVNGLTRAFGTSELDFERQLKASGYVFALYDPASREFIRGNALWETSGNLFAVSEADIASIQKRLRSSTSS